MCRQRFFLSSVRKEDHLLLDLGLLLIAKGLRQNAFADHANLASLLAGRDHILRWKPEFQRRPLFCSATERGMGLKVDAPMKYASASIFFKKTAVRAGLPGNVDVGHSGIHF